MSCGSNYIEHIITESDVDGLDVSRDLSAIEARIATRYPDVTSSDVASAMLYEYDYSSDDHSSIPQNATVGARMYLPGYKLCILRPTNTSENETSVEVTDYTRRGNTFSSIAEVSLAVAEAYVESAGEVNFDEPDLVDVNIDTNLLGEVEVEFSQATVEQRLNELIAQLAEIEYLEQLSQTATNPDQFMSDFLALEGQDVEWVREQARRLWLIQLLVQRDAFADARIALGFVWNVATIRPIKDEQGNWRLNFDQPMRDLLERYEGYSTAQLEENAKSYIRDIIETRIQTIDSQSPNLELTRGRTPPNFRSDETRDFLNEMRAEYEALLARLDASSLDTVTFDLDFIHILDEKERVMYPDLEF